MMAVKNSDLLVVQTVPDAGETSKLYKLSVGNLPKFAPNGTEEGQYLAWDGTKWEPTNVIDGGEYS